MKIKLSAVPVRLNKQRLKYLRCVYPKVQLGLYYHYILPILTSYHLNLTSITENCHYRTLLRPSAIHVKERNAIFPFPESCPFFSESERKAGLIWKGRKGTGKERYDGAKFPFLSISDFPIWKTKFSISSKKVIKLGGHFLEFCITSNGRALVGALVGVMEGHFYHVELTW